MKEFFEYSTLALFWFFFAINSFYVLLILISIPLVSRRFKEAQFERIETLLESETLPQIGIIMPFHGGKELVVNSIKNALNLEYPNLEVIAINDESQDETFEMVQEIFALRKALPRVESNIPTEKVKGVYRSQLYPNLIVVDKISRGRKGDASNAGINEARASLIAIVDDDTILEKECLLRMIRPFYHKKGFSAQGGTLRILNGCTVKEGQITKVDVPKNVWSGIQIVEYLRAFLYGRLGWNPLGGPLIVSGAFGLFRKDRILEIKGYDPGSIGEDFELTARLQKCMREKGEKHVIHFIPDPVAWTTVPDTVESLKRQRIRWHQGLMEVLSTYRKMLFNPTYGKAGMIGYPYMLFGEFLEPFIEIFGIFLICIGTSLDYLAWMNIVFIILVTWGITVSITCISILLEVTTFRRYTKAKQILRLLFLALIESFVFRPLYFVWRFMAVFRTIVGKKTW